MMLVIGAYGNLKKGSNGILRNNLLIRLLFLAQTLTAYLTVLSFFSWTFASLGKYHWTVTFRPLLARYRWEDEGQKKFAETYYDRDCDRRDFSTSDFNDLIIRDKWDFTKAAENILTHGASIFPKVIDRDLADAFRNYTLKRNERLKPEEMVYVMNAKTKTKQTRWSFAFTGQDQPLIIPKILEQIVNHEKLVGVLELFLGKDPAIIKMQTITQRYKADHQGWHPDVNAKASVKSHARNFMMHFSLFITLQDTTPKMGATGVCPGTQYCTTVEDNEFGCKQVTSGNLFPESQNETMKHTNPGVWMAGDAVLMNQNTFHRGWKHNMQNGPDRAIMVLTFTSRPRYSNGRNPQHPLSTPLPSQIWRSKMYQSEKNASISSADAKNFPIQSWVDERKKLIHPESRVLSLGTPLTSFGFTLYDLKDSLTSMSKLLTALRFLGIYKPPNANWGWDYVTSVFSRISTETHKFKKDDLRNWLSKQRMLIKRNKNSLNLKLRLQSKFIEWYMTRVLVGMPPADKQMGIWDSWISLSLHKGTKHFRKSLIWNCMVYTVISIVVAWILSTRNEHADDNDDNIPVFYRDTQHHRPENNSGKSEERRPYSFQGALLKGFLKPFTVVCVISFIRAYVHWKLESSILVRDIQSGRKIQSSFPDMTAAMNNPSSFSLLPMVGVRRITHGRGRVEFVNPTRDDILIGTRFDSLYLRIVNRFLDYHTGNRVWRKCIKEASASTTRGFFFSAKEVIPIVVIDSILREMKGKLLLQTPETGNFTVLTNGDSRIYTRRALIVEHSFLLSELDRSISFMISEMRFESSLRTTPLAFFAVGMLEGIREIIFGESDQTRSYLFTKNKENKRQSGSATSTPLRQLRLLTPVKNYVATLKPEKIKFLKHGRKKGATKLNLGSNKRVGSGRKRWTNGTAKRQR